MHCLPVRPEVLTSPVWVALDIADHLGVAGVGVVVLVVILARRGGRANQNRQQRHEANHDTFLGSKDK